ECLFACSRQSQGAYQRGSLLIRLQGNLCNNAAYGG
ncbi:hypothetical protein RCH06_003198, partial [Polaromonas sp. CG_9.5]|nr:hypothetical protein [Polaromonas sp. CG_9.5]